MKIIGKKNIMTSTNDILKIEEKKKKKSNMKNSMNFFAF
jgi:hypothetical protein